MKHTATSLPLDNDGFLAEPAAWNEQIAQSIAALDGISTLTESHWAIIKSLREHYFRNGTLPYMKHICHENHLGDDCFDVLFHHSYRGAWRIAGLPNPGEEAKAYM